MIPQRLKTVMALRDVFMAKNELMLAKGFQDLGINFDNTQQLEGDFNRYFVGPQAPIAAPYASLYLENSGMIMGETTHKVRDFFSLIGLSNPQKNKIPEDFLGLELDAYYQLLYIELIKDIQYLQALRYDFLKTHMAVWIPQFIKSVRDYTQKPSAEVLALVEILEAFINSELSIQGDIS